MSASSEINTLANQAFLNQLAGTCFQIAKEHGSWEGTTDPASPGTVPTKLMLIVSEVAEALKADRDLHTEWERTHDILEELADVVIRCFDLAAHISGHGANDSFGRILLDKISINADRPRLHGKRY